MLFAFYSMTTRDVYEPGTQCSVSTADAPHQTGIDRPGKKMLNKAYAARALREVAASSAAEMV